MQNIVEFKSGEIILTLECNVSLWRFNISFSPFHTEYMDIPLQEVFALHPKIYQNG